MRISWSISAITYAYLKCIVYDKLSKTRQSFLMTLYNTVPVFRRHILYYSHAGLRLVLTEQWNSQSWGHVQWHAAYTNNKENGSIRVYNLQLIVVFHFAEHLSVQ